MAGEHGDPEGGSSAFRRRRSSAQDDDAVELGDRAREHGVGQSTYFSPQNTPPASAASLASAATTATGVDAASSGVTHADVDIAPKTVRFSTDIDRDSTAKRSVSGSASNSTRWKPIPKASERRRSMPGLSLDTAVASDSSRTTITTGEALFGSLNGSTLGSGQVSRAASLSAGGRNRGYSLRRSLFNRNLDDTLENTRDGTVIELEDAGSSHRHASPPSFTDSPKKSGAASITVTQVDELELPPRPDPKKKRFSGPSALPNYENWLADNLSRRKGYQQRARQFIAKIKKTILRVQEIPPTKDGRHLDLDPSRKKPLIDERTNRDYVDNNIRSSRYSVWDFLPRQLFAQFRKLANFYFLCISILQMIPGLSTTGNYTTIVPLLFFVGVSIGKEGYDDYRRYKLDKAENLREVNVLHAYRATESSNPSPEGREIRVPSGPLHWAAVKWRSLKVGDVIKLKRDDPVPADVILLRATGPNGVAYIETMALDGETNLKSKQTTASLAKHCTSEAGLANCRAHFVVEDPNADLYNFEGRVTVDGETSPLTTGEILYRGSILRNTSEAIAMVIYTGEECKIRMNANKHPRIKAPSLQFVVNRIVIVIVFFVLALAVFNTAAYQVWKKTTERHAFYLTHARVPFFPNLTAFLIMFNTMIPLSLYVSLEIVKLFQMILMNDIDMYDPKTDTPFEARTSTINEELGQVSYVFSDKTGTLTDNEMRFRKMSIAGTAWLHDFDIKEDKTKMLMHKKRNKGKKPARKSRISMSGDQRKASMDPTASNRANDAANGEDEAAVEHESGAGVKRWKSSARPGNCQPDMNTRDLIRYIQARPYTAFAKKSRFFLLSLALCHTCLPETQPDGSITFQAASPDELALVTAAQELGFLVIDRDAGTLTLKYLAPAAGTTDMITESYEILDVIEFSSKRKRMSVIVRFPDGRRCIICKGADSIIMKRLKLAALADQKVAEIEKRANRRKSLEAQYAMARKSEQMERKSSLSRPSLTIGRPSISGVRRSITGARLHPVKDELDDWLSKQEQVIEVNNVAEQEQQFYTPRPSAQLNRLSMAISEPRSSMQWDDLEELVDENLVNDEPAILERCFQHVNDFATEGLRTLLYSSRFINDEEYAGWKKLYLEATTSLVDRQRKIEQVGEMIEQNLELVGATAIEDKLQKGVPETIDKLRRANIKMWMLTGDKRETAINIGHSCRLIKDYSTVVVLDSEAGEVEKNIAAAIISINENAVAHCVVVIDGHTLSVIEMMPAIEKLFFELTVLADSVVCCRASPSQKAKLVNSIRKKVKNSITLAIGDGANDIAMIQEAHVGIGITGKEGLQAARTSDYSIAQFRFLSKLLLVHGRWNYVRTCKYTVGTFWKEMVFYLTQALYQRWAGYTGTSLYEPWSLSMFNTLFTSLPVIFMGIFEKDLAASTLLAVPELYTLGQRNGGFNIRIYLEWMFMASAEAMVVYFCMLGLFGQTSFTHDNSLFAMGDLTFTACVIIIWAKMQAIEMHNKSIVTVVSLIGCTGGWFLWNLALSYTYHNNTIYAVKDGFMERFGQSSLWWLTLILILTCVLIFEVGVHALRAAWFPSDVDTFREFEQDRDIRRRFEEAAAMDLQQGWDRGAKKSSFEIAGPESKTAANRKLDRDSSRDRTGHESEAEDAGRVRESVDIQEMLARRLGGLQQE